MNTIHEVAHLTRRMDAEEYRRLVESIREDGQLYPILRANGQVIDGRHRLEACREVGIEPRFLDVEVPEEKLAEVALSANHIRKADSPAVRALDAARLTDLESEQGHPPAQGKLSIKAACKALQTSVTQVRRARMVLQHDIDGRMESIIRAGLHPLPQDEGDFDGIEALIKRAELKVPTGTLPEAETPIAENPEFQRLAREAEQLKKDLRAARKRDRKDAENSDMARMLAETQAALAEAQIKLAAADNDALALAEAMKARVVIEKDPTAERMLKETQSQLAEATEAKRRAEHDAIQFQKNMLAATEELAVLKNRLSEVQNSERLFEIFGKQVHDWRSLATTVAKVVRQHRMIDPHTEKVCRETAKRLEQIAESLNDNRSAPGRATVTQLQIA